MSGDVRDEWHPIQQGVARIWAKELNLSTMGLDDDFFSLNGDSLNMLNMLFEVNKVYGLDLPPGALFENSSLRAFSLVVALAAESSQRSNAEPAFDSLSATGCI